MLILKEAEKYNIPCEVHLLYEDCKTCMRFFRDISTYYPAGEMIPNKIIITCKNSYICSYVMEHRNGSKELP